MIVKVVILEREVYEGRLASYARGLFPQLTLGLRLRLTN